MVEKVKAIASKSTTKQNLNFAFVFIVYIIAANLFQILGIYEQYPTLDSAWKATVLLGLLSFTIFKVRKAPTINRSYWPFFVALLLYQLVNPLVTGDIPRSIGEITAIAFPPISFFVFLILFNTYNMNERQLMLFMKLFVIFILYACIFNIFVNYDIITSLSTNVRSYELNLSAFFDNRNTFGFYLFLAAACNFYLILKNRRNLFFYFTIFVIIGSLLLTLSRSSIVALMVFLLAFLVLENRIKLYFKYLAACIGIIVAVAMIPSLNEFITNNVIREEAGLSGRDAVYTQAAGLLDTGKDILFGIGYNNSQSQLEQQTGYTSAHNTYLAILIRGGVLLLSFFIIAMIFAANKMTKVRQYNKQLGNFLIALLISYLIYSFAESQVIFFSSVTSFTITTFIILIPLYLSNSYTSRTKHANL